MKRQASAVWEGGLKDGNGFLSTESGILDKNAYSFQSRFEQAKQTNPEELIAAAHAGCFSMALSKILSERGLAPSRIATEATVSLEQQGDGFAITQVHLDVQSIMQAATYEDFQKAASEAKENCPVSKLLNAEITMTARLMDAG